MNTEEVEAQENGERYDKKEPKNSSQNLSGKKKDEQSSSPRGVLEGTHNNLSDLSSSSFGSSSSPPEEEEEKTAGDGGGGRRGLNWKNWFDQKKKRKNRGRKVLGRIRSSEETLMDSCNLPISKPSWRNFSFEELVQATHNFSPDNLIGQGGHAQVYKGYLADGQIVAVKKITRKEKKDDDRVRDFLSELGIIAYINHPNAAKLIGFSADGGELHLVLQYLPHGSLASVLHGSEESLEWRIRFKVAIGIAEGLHYLHWDCQKRIIHRDITASNILLTEDYEPQISDFGLAKWLPEKWSRHVVSPIEGTFGYLAPEYFMHGVVDEKTDVFAFGVLLLELITGRRAVDSSRQSLVIWAKSLLEKNNTKELADHRLGDAYDIAEMKRVMFTAFMCIHCLPNMRPNMKMVVQLLKGESEEVDLKHKSVGGRALLLGSFDLEDYTSTTYLKDLNRHMQLVME